MAGILEVSTLNLTSPNGLVTKPISIDNSGTPFFNGVQIANTASPTFTGTVILPSTTSIGTVSSTEIGYLDGVTSAIQTQLGTKAPLATPTFTGLVTLDGGQIKFPATQVPSADANTLDDYEEGTWTPAIAFGGATTGITYLSQVGTYTKIGKRVFLDGTIGLSNKGSATGFFTLINFPFMSESIANHFVNFPCQAFNFDTTKQVSLQVNYGSGIFMVLLGSDSALENTAFTNTTVIRFSLSYTV